MISNTLPAKPHQGPSAPAAPPPGKAFAVDPEAFRAHYNRKPFLVRHNLTDHPLFTLPRLIELARRMPEEFVEYNAGNIPVSIDHKLTPRNGLSIEETIRRIEDHCSWMVMKRVEQDPEFNAFLDFCLDGIAEFSEPLDPGMYDRAGAVFISSPGSVTPYHLDAEYNFLLQFRGSKTISVFDAFDRSLITEEEIERHCGVAVIDRNLVFKEEYQQKATVFELTPGHALHVPPLFPHWVKNGPQVSISFSAGYLTRGWERRDTLYQCNRSLRKLGLKPTPPGQSPLRDALKYQGHRAWRRVTGLFGHSGKK